MLVNCGFYFLLENSRDLVCTITNFSFLFLAIGFVLLISGYHMERHTPIQHGYKYHVNQVVQYVQDEDWQFRFRFGKITKNFLDGNGEKWYNIVEEDGSEFHVPEHYIMDVV